MFQSFFTGLSGMLSFSKNLDNVSNNIANMNTPGFKASDTFYRSLTSGDTALGTQVSGQEQRFSSGDVRQTGNATDLAIAGESFFVLLENGDARYTRAGQFSFNDEGFLVDSVTGSQVAAVNDSGQLEPVSISNLRVLAPQATTEIAFTGNLSTDMNTVNIDGVTAFNGLGEQVTLNFQFTNNSATTAGSWTVLVTDSNGNTLHQDNILFDGNGTPVNNANSLSFDLTDSQGGTDTLNLSFGDGGAFSGSTSVSGGSTSTLQANVTDGHTIASLTGVSFTSQGQLQLTYSNGQVEDGPFLAVANFTDQSVLDLVEGSVFSSVDNSGLSIGKANSGGRGSIVAESIELSNVDLSREFADMIIIQRGYQASSRILNVANQLLDQLYENTRG